MGDLELVSGSVCRAREIVRDLSQTRSPGDIAQMVAGLQHELDYAERKLQSMMDEAAMTAFASQPGKVRADAPETSRRAAKRIELVSGTQRMRVALDLYDHGPSADFEIQARTGLNPSSERPRRGELVEGGFVEPTGRTRRHNGEEWTVWKLTNRGWSACFRERGGDGSITARPEEQEEPGLF